MLRGGVQELADKRLEQSKRLTQLRYELRFEDSMLCYHPMLVLFLRAKASFSSNQKICSRNVHEKEPDLAKVLWEITMKECEQGVLEGPFSDVGDVRHLLGCDRFVCSRRFLIIQNGKPRVIDDLKESCVNSAQLLTGWPCMISISLRRWPS